METEKLEMLRKQWYMDKNVIHNIIDALKFREGAFLQLREEGRDFMMRYLKINHSDYFYKNAQRYRFFECRMNLYNTLAKLPNMPMFSFSKVQKDKDTKEYGEGQYHKDITSFDFMIDIDSSFGKENTDLEPLQFAHHETMEIKKIFDDYDIPYWLKFSGQKGFHVMVDSTDYPEEFKKMSIPDLAELFKKVVHNFKMVNDFRFIDEGVFDTKRLSKTAYSVTYPFYFVAYPLTDEELKTFSLKMVSLPYLITKTKDLFQRRTCKRKGNPDGFLKFIKDYENL